MQQAHNPVRRTTPPLNSPANSGIPISPRPRVSSSIGLEAADYRASCRSSSPSSKPTSPFRNPPPPRRRLSQLYRKLVRLQRPPRLGIALPALLCSPSPCPWHRRQHPHCYRLQAPHRSHCLNENLYDVPMAQEDRELCPMMEKVLDSGTRFCIRNPQGRLRRAT